MALSDDVIVIKGSLCAHSPKLTGAAVNVAGSTAILRLDIERGVDCGLARNIDRSSHET